MTTNDKINIYIIYEIKEYLEIIIQFKIYRICIKIISSGSPEVHGWEYICDQTFSRQNVLLAKRCKLAGCITREEQLLA